MNTVDALNVLGKALCGDSFEVKPGLTDAETILEIAKNYEGGGSGIEIKRKMGGNFDPLPIGLTASDFIGAALVTYFGETPISYLPAISIYPSEEEISISVADTRNGQISLMSFIYNRGTGEVTAN